jgi:transglutaminase-like putative cysteine protease
MRRHDSTGQQSAVQVSAARFSQRSADQRISPDRGTRRRETTTAFSSTDERTMQYQIRHLTRFTYHSPVSESVMELRMQPLTDRRQRSLRFDVTTNPRARIFAYRDHLGNAVHYFDIPGHHLRLDLTAEATVDVSPSGPLPERLADDAWNDIGTQEMSGEFVNWLAPSRFARDTPALLDFARSIGLARDRDPLTLLRALTRTLYDEFAYEPRTTHVDSPIDEALAARAGVCQDFAHIMTALVRGLGIPCRYVSGYLASSGDAHDRSTANATHAWVEARLPGLGWVGFDPTNDTLTQERHIAVAVGRDYGDVPPTRGIFKGGTGSELRVAVTVSRSELPIHAQDLSPTVSWISSERPVEDRLGEDFHQQQQQQQ